MDPNYGFHGRLRAEFPSQVIIDTTELCNLACIHCPHPQFKKSEHYSGASLEPELNAKAVDEVRTHGSQYIRYSAEGETFLNKNFVEMLRYATQNSGEAAVTVTTNGTIFNEEKIQQVLATELDIIDISIDAFSPETYAKIRVNGKLDVTRANVCNLITANRGTKTKIVVSYIEQPKNQHETDDFEKYWKDQGADYVVVRRLHSAAGAKDQIAQQMRQESEKTSRRPCVYPWERIVLNPRGNLAFCPADWTYGGTIVDYRTTTIKETWQGEFYQRLREAHLNNDYSQFPFCDQCPDWMEIRWPHEGRAYANMVEEFNETE